VVLADDVRQRAGTSCGHSKQGIINLWSEMQLCCFLSLLLLSQDASSLWQGLVACSEG